MGDNEANGQSPGEIVSCSSWMFKASSDSTQSWGAFLALTRFSHVTSARWDDLATDLNAHIVGRISVTRAFRGDPPVEVPVDIK